MRDKIRKYLSKSDSLLKHTGILFTGSMVGNVFNYLYQLYMGRALGPVDYGILGSIFSIITIFGAFTTAAQTAITSFVAGFKARKEYGKIHSLVVFSLKRFFYLGFFIFMLFILMRTSISSFLNIENARLIILTGVVILLSFICPIPNGVLNGLQRFKLLSLLSGINPGTKLFFGIILVYMGFGVGGAIAGVLLSTILGIMLSIMPLRFLFSEKKEELDKVDFMQYSVSVFLSILAITVLTNIDVLLVKHYFSPQIAGYYTAAALLGKIVLFVSGILVAVMYPKISEVHSQNRKTEGILRDTLLYTLLISSSIAVVYFVSPDFISRMLFGREYVIQDIIGPFAIAFGFFSLSNVLIMYNLAVKKTSVVFIPLAAILVEVIAVSMFHSTLIEVIKILVVIHAVLFNALLIYTKEA